MTIEDENTYQQLVTRNENLCRYVENVREIFVTDFVNSRYARINIKQRHATITKVEIRSITARDCALQRCTVIFIYDETLWKLRTLFAMIFLFLVRVRNWC